MSKNFTVDGSVSVPLQDGQTAAPADLTLSFVYTKKAGFDLVYTDAVADDIVRVEFSVDPYFAAQGAYVIAVMDEDIVYAGDRSFSEEAGYLDEFAFFEGFCLEQFYLLFI